MACLETAPSAQPRQLTSLLREIHLMENNNQINSSSNSNISLSPDSKRRRIDTTVLASMSTEEEQKTEVQVTRVTQTIAKSETVAIAAASDGSGEHDDGGAAHCDGGSDADSDRDDDDDDDNSQLSREQMMRMRHFLMQDAYLSQAMATQREAPRVHTKVGFAPVDLDSFSREEAIDLLLRDRMRMMDERRMLVHRFLQYTSALESLVKRKRASGDTNDSKSGEAAVTTSAANTSSNTDANRSVSQEVESKEKSNTEEEKRVDEETVALSAGSAAEAPVSESNDEKHTEEADASAKEEDDDAKSASNSASGAGASGARDRSASNASNASASSSASSASSSSSSSDSSFNPNRHDEEMHGQLQLLKRMFSSRLGASPAWKTAPACLWYPEDSEPAPAPTLDDILHYIERRPCKNIIVLSGAGISVAAGIPDFRTPGTGLYDNLQRFSLPTPESIFDIRYFKERPQAFYMLAKEMWPGNFRPTAAHFFIKALSDRGVLLRNYTQNIDTLEEIAGIPHEKLVFAHGSYSTSRCIFCSKEHSSEIVKDAVFSDTMPFCECGGLIKPEITFFGESLPKRFNEMARVDFLKCDLLLVLGTSLQVQPFASLVHLVPRWVPRVLINMNRAGVNDDICDVLGIEHGFRFESPLPRQYMRDVCVLGDCQRTVMRMARRLGMESAIPTDVWPNEEESDVNAKETSDGGGDDEKEKKEGKGEKEEEEREEAEEEEEEEEEASSSSSEDGPEEEKVGDLMKRVDNRR